MLLTLLVASVVLAVVGVLLLRHFRPEIDHAIADLNGAVAKLERVVETKSAAIVNHLDEIALHQKKISLKGADRDRAQRIVARLNELLQ